MNHLVTLTVSVDPKSATQILGRYLEPVSAAAAVTWNEKSEAALEGEVRHGRLRLRQKKNFVNWWAFEWKGLIRRVPGGVQIHLRARRHRFARIGMNLGWTVVTLGWLAFCVIAFQAFQDPSSRALTLRAAYLGCHVSLLSALLWFLPKRYCAIAQKESDFIASHIESILQSESASDREAA